jgi:hypothetical protein
VGRRVRRETSERLHALALPGDGPAARLLVGRHDHVNEPLEEVALMLLARAPRLLEGLVRLEERSGPSQRKAPLV